MADKPILTKENLTIPYWLNAKEYDPERDIDFKGNKMHFSVQVLFCVRNIGSTSIWYDYQMGYYDFQAKEWISVNDSYFMSKNSEVIGWMYLFPPIS